MRTAGAGACEEARLRLLVPNGCTDAATCTGDARHGAPRAVRQSLFHQVGQRLPVHGYAGPLTSRAGSTGAGEGHQCIHDTVVTPLLTGLVGQYANVSDETHVHAAELLTEALEQEVRTHAAWLMLPWRMRRACPSSTLPTPTIPPRRMSGDSQRRPFASTSTTRTSTQAVSEGIRAHVPLLIPRAPGTQTRAGFRFPAAVLTSREKQLIKEKLMPTAAAYIQANVRVKNPVSGKLFLPRLCATQWTGVNICQQLRDVGWWCVACQSPGAVATAVAPQPSAPVCIPSSIAGVPDATSAEELAQYTPLARSFTTPHNADYFGAGQYCPDSPGVCVNSSSGTGVQDADLIIYVTAQVRPGRATLALRPRALAQHPVDWHQSQSQSHPPY